MIIKYYYKGWNIIDNVENVNLNFERTDNLYNEFVENEELSIIRKDYEDGFSTKSHVFETLCFFNITHKLEVGEFNAIEAVGEPFAEKFFNNGDQNGISFVQVLTFNKKDSLMKNILVTDGDIYLMNNDGKTIDKFSSRD